MSATLDDILTSHRTGRAVVMGVLNVTPDSFSDGGRFLEPGEAVEQARRMIDQGADIIDIGAESTRPGSDRVSGDEQIARLRRILPPVTATGAAVSIDTTIADVAEFALDAGAKIINDVSAGRDDPRLLDLAGSRAAAVVLMHMLGRPKTMQQDPHYDDVVTEVRDFLAIRIEVAVGAGVQPERIIVDPGIGFGKSLAHNLSLLAELSGLQELDCPVLVGPSRKRFIGELTGIAQPEDRLSGTIAACLAARERGATIFRVHDVGEVAAAIKVAQAVENALPPEKSSP